MNTNISNFSTFMKQEMERVRSNFKFLELYRCPQCGSDQFEDVICQYCHEKSIKLKVRIKKIDESLNRVLKKMNELNIENVENDFEYFNQLYEFSVSNKNLYDKSKIEIFLQKTKYKQFLINNLVNKLNNQKKLTKFEKSLFRHLININDFIPPELIQKISVEESISSSDIKLMEYLLSLGQDKNDDIFLISNYIIKDAILKKRTFSLETLEQAFLQVATNFIGAECQDFNCSIEEVITIKSFQNEKVLGLHEIKDGKHNIKILRELLNDLYYNGNSIIFEVMFHEINHIVQYKQNMILKGFPTKEKFMQAIDDIISQYVDDYSHVNYNALSYEIDSRIEGYSRSKYYLELLGINPADEYEIYLKAIEELETNESELRMINAKEVDLELFFNDFIRNRFNFLNKFPILKYKYKINGYIVELKDYDELNKDFLEMFNKNPNNSEQVRTFYHFLFEGLLNYQISKEQEQNDKGYNQNKS